MHPRGERISEKPSGRGCYVRKLAAIIGLPITQAQRDSSSNMAIIRRMVRSDAMCRAFAAAYEVNGPQLTEPKARTIPSGMRQTVRLRLAGLAPSAEEV
jgi:hypothetical protein